MWVGTQSGIAPVIRKPPPFVNYTHRQRTRQPCGRHDLVRAGRQAGRPVDRDGDGPSPARSADGRMTLYRHDPKEPHSLSYDKVSGIREDPSGALWIGTLRRGGRPSRCHDRQIRCTIATTRRTRTSLDSNLVLSVLHRPEGRVVGGDAGGRAEPVRSHLRPLHGLPDAGAELRPVDIRGPGGNPLARGIPWRHLVRPPHGAAHRPWPRRARSPHVSATTKHGPLHEDKQGRLWIATSSGLNELDRARGTFTSITRKDGLAGNSVRAILEEEGYLWLATDGGLTRFHPETRSVPQLHGVRRPARQSPEPIRVAGHLAEPGRRNGDRLNQRPGHVFSRLGCHPIRMSRPLS